MVGEIHPLSGWLMIILLNFLRIWNRTQTLIITTLKVRWDIENF